MSNASGPSGRLVRKDGTPAHAETAPLGPPPDSPQWVAQTALAGLIKQPERPLLPMLLELCSGRDTTSQVEALQIARDLMEHVVDSLRSGAESAPVLIDRYSFAWRVLRQADVAARRIKKTDIPSRGSVPAAAAVFGSLLPVPMNEPMVGALCDSLRLGPNARYLPQYCTVRKGNIKQGELPPPFGYALDGDNREMLATAAWWSIRLRKEEYVEIDADEVRVQFAFLVNETLNDLRKWYGPIVDSKRWVAEVVEDEINRWIQFSGLVPSADRPLKEDVRRDLAKAFLKHNELTTKLRTVEGVPAPPDERVAALEAQLREYAEENRILEERLRGTLERSPSTASPPAAATRDENGTRNFLRAVDSKYSLDALESIQLGEDTHLTLRSFVTHLFYCARKQGLAQYPQDKEFDLSYADSGLYECDGFEVSPGSTVRVRVARRGWALQNGKVLVPIRRAHVTRMEPASGVGR